MTSLISTFINFPHHSILLQIPTQNVTGANISVFPLLVSCGGSFQIKNIYDPNTDLEAGGNILQ